MIMSTKMFRSFRSNKILFPLCLSLMFFGCETGSRTDSSQTETDHEIHEKKIDEVAISEAEKSLEADGLGKCSNPYYPLETKTDRAYKIEGTAPATYVLKQKLRNNDGFTETRNFASGTEVVSSWSCTDEGLRNVDYNSVISTPNIKAKMETLESSGITIPKVWEKGKKWTANYKIRMNILGKSIGGTVTVDNEIVSMDDNVSVQAGDYVAARIDSIIQIKLSAKFPRSNATMSNWYAPKVGLIKQETKMGSTNASVEYTGEK